MLTMGRGEKVRRTKKETKTGGREDGKTAGCSGLVRRSSRREVGQLRGVGNKRGEMILKFGVVGFEGVVHARSWQRLAPTDMAGERRRGGGDAGG